MTRKLILPAVGLSLLGAAALTAFEVNVAYNTAWNNLQGRIQHAATAVSLRWRSDVPKSADSALDALRNSRFITGAKLLLNPATANASPSRSGEGITHHDVGLMMATSENDLFRSGTLRVFIDEQKLRKTTFGRWPRRFAVNMAGGLGLAASLLALLHFMVTRRFRRLIAAIDNGGPQRPSAAVAPEAADTDELERATRAVAQLKSRLKEAYVKQAEANETLQEKVSQLTAAQNAAQASRKRLVQVISSAPVALIVVDGEGTVRLCEGLAVQALGLNHDPVGAPVSTLFPDRPHSHAILRRARFGESFSAEIEIQDAFFEIRFSPLTENGTGTPPGFIAVAHDVTERIRHERKLLDGKHTAEAANQAKSQFIATVSHEIRTPLGAILGFTELLQRRHTESQPDDESAHLQAVQRNAQVLLNLVNDLLDVSKIESGQLVVEPKIHDIRDLFHEALTPLVTTAHAKGLTLHLHAETSVPSNVVTDSRRFAQILSHVVGNAIKFSERGEILVAVRYENGNNNAPRLGVDVTDSGIGIADEEKPSVFDPFFQSDQSVGRRFGGSGLGLSISRRLAQALGGDVKLLASRPGEGSTFSVTIDPGPSDTAGPRLANLELGSERVKAPLTDSATRPLEGIHVLVVEDCEDNQVLFRHFLESANAQVTVANGGRDGLQKAFEGDFHVVLMDIQMPDLDGYRVTSILRRQGYRRPIIALTAHAMKGDLERSLSAGCSYYISKPVTRNELIEQVARFARFTDEPDESDPLRRNDMSVPPRTREPDSKLPKRGEHDAPAQSHQNGSTDTDADNEDWSESRYERLRSLYEEDPRMKTIIDQFKKKLPSRVKSLRNSVRDGDREQSADLAHQLKGSLGGYGFPELCDKAAELEDKLKSRDDLHVVLEELDALDAAAQHPEGHQDHPGGNAQPH